MTLPKSFTKVTPFSKWLALSMLVIIPVLAFFYGQYYERVTKTAQTQTTQVQPTPIDTEDPLPRSETKEGEMCGGIAGIQCQEGLTCQLDENYPDAGGHCVKEK